MSEELNNKITALGDLALKQTRDAEEAIGLRMTHDEMKTYYFSIGFQKGIAAAKVLGPKLYE